MKYVGIAMLLFLCSLNVIGQTGAEGKKIPQYVKFPPENVLVLVASQPDCPLKIQEASYLTAANGGADYEIAYEVKNVSSRPIRLFSLVAWSAVGAGGNMIIDVGRSGHSLLPGQTLDSGKLGRDYEIVPLTDKSWERLRPQGSKDQMRIFWVVMVERVIFEDGTVYSNQKVSEELQEFLLHWGSTIGYTDSEIERPSTTVAIRNKHISSTSRLSERSYREHRFSYSCRRRI